MDTKLLFENFDLIAQSSGGVQRLRELILILAVRGKLAPQEPKDEPASVMLERIRVEKAILVKDGKIRETRELLSIKDEEKEFELPRNWEWVRIGNILNFEYGESLPKNSRSSLGKVPVYGSNGIVGYHSTVLVKGPCIIVGRKGSAGAVNVSELDCWPIDTTFFIKPSLHLDFSFVTWLLKSLKMEQAKISIVPGIQREEVYGRVVAVPSLNEQKKISQEIGKLNSICNEIENRQREQGTRRLSFHRSSTTALNQAQTTPDFKKAWQRLADNFDWLYQDEENLKELRQTILQLAVRGKLVPQDPKDEPASVLLERIRAEKAKLVKEGKISTLR